MKIQAHYNRKTKQSTYARPIRAGELKINADDEDLHLYKLVSKKKQSTNKKPKSHD